MSNDEMSNDEMSNDEMSNNEMSNDEMSKLKWKVKRKFEMLSTTLVFRPFYFDSAIAKYDIFYRVDK
jgi:hypothetical protein